MNKYDKLMTTRQIISCFGVMNYSYGLVRATPKAKAMPPPAGADPGFPVGGGANPGGANI